MIKVWVLWLLLVNADNHLEWHAMEASREHRVCVEAALKYQQIGGGVGSRIITALCKESKA